MSADREGIVQLPPHDPAPFRTHDRYITKQKLLYLLHNRHFNEETKGTF